MLGDDRFTDTISRNTSVQSAIERFDQRKPMMVQSRPKSSKTPSPEGTTNIQHQNLPASAMLAPPVPLPRRLSSPTRSPPQGELKPSSASPSEPYMVDRKPRSNTAQPNTEVLLHPRDDLMYHQMKFPNQPFRPSNYGAGITGVYQQTVNTAVSEDDGYGDELDVSPVGKELATAPRPPRDILMKQVCLKYLL
ncbi:hypothetical protein Y032_0006g3162 [Ancylostoma ceylanicum]|uniref:Uncharacterized protein n=1 Tax=Ancylostoma ceylanicum TaxID=53326 RepID=A0A016VR04_9BILA|nr:hypothetical protein Y032_0006g3162 [Ancylostoma ceylanicum]